MKISKTNSHDIRCLLVLSKSFINHDAVILLTARNSSFLILLKKIMVCELNNDEHEVVDDNPNRETPIPKHIVIFFRKDKN